MGQILYWTCTSKGRENPILFLEMMQQQVKHVQRPRFGFREDQNCQDDGV